MIWGMSVSLVWLQFPTVHLPIAIQCAALLRAYTRIFDRDKKEALFDEDAVELSENVDTTA